MNRIFNFGFFYKLRFLLKKPRVVIITGRGRELIKEALSKILKQHFKVNDKILILETDLANSWEIKKFKFFVKKSSLPILIVTHLSDPPPDQIFWASEKEEKAQNIIQLAKSLPSRGYLILNFDDETARAIKDATNLNELTFGFQKRADFRATDIRITKVPDIGTNFKINYKGKIVPIWMPCLFGKQQIYTALAAISCGRVLGLNLVEVSEALKLYRSLPGRMRLIKGIKNSLVLDDSSQASAFSMIEALEVLKKIEAKRKIAVLGDVIGIGKYAIEAHEKVGEKVGQVADLLFTVGPRAKFIARGAFKRGLSEEKMFNFHNADAAAKAVQDQIEQGDLILVTGSKQMKMPKVVKEIKK